MPEFDKFSQVVSLVTRMSKTKTAVRDKLVRSALRKFGRSFEGEIYEDDRDVPMIPAYSNDGKPFDIETCCYWKEPFQVANRDSTRLIVLRAANQIFKTGFCEMVGKHKIKHDPDHMCFYDWTILACNDHAKTRLMPMFKSIPGLGEIIQRVEDDNRHEVTNTDIMLPGMILRVRPLNEASTQRITLRYIFIHDASLSERSGQIRRAKIRATQFSGRELVVIESQGGKVEQDNPDDFTAQMNTTDERLLFVNCPECNSAMQYKWEHYRPDNFIAIPPKSVASLDHSSWITHHTQLLLQPERRRCGFKTDPADLMDGQKHDDSAVLATTHYECPHCGSRWEDDGVNGSTRRAIDRSSHYHASRTNVLPGMVGFSIPCWINTRIRWGEIMLEKIRADVAHQNGDELLLQDWTQKRAGETWNPAAAKVKFNPVTATTDPLKAIPNERFRYMTVDCQKDRQLSAIKGTDMTGHFWVHAGAVDQKGNEQQLWRAYCTSWDEWIAKAEELGIPVMNISVDGGYKPDEVLNQAAAHAKLTDEVDPQGLKTGRKFWATWTMMKGDDAHTFRWKDGYRRLFSESKIEPVILETDGKRVPIDVNVIWWSNFRVKNILHETLMENPRYPKLSRLPDGSPLLSDKTRSMEVGDFTWQRQMEAEALGTDGLGKSAKMKWQPLHKQKHQRDNLCMGIVKKLQAGMFGAVSAPEQSASEAQ